ncbi:MULTISPECIES: LysR family transcriptional regulator [unclassified Bosea (in: a-proteobacteria)]|uniref:LysR family transcriptional regulator n=1 Tax=unclassified Bosea (in: a-proteobacteria) TaxID=2653178 RepID=UPI000954A07A|nr:MULTISPECIES: LysR family transcriptional regulator [unclassified Bosea (in: a-proteobacteria)]TAJ28079.1 MAG: LysR family transcriptional regulator [Bosea sp. (in: a-proteobacteria)]SIR51459.1 DNA-binding transcriptional regulator, LysR family [Bosea sp. TND4EK4]
MHAAALFYFREVARLGSIRRAAGQLNVAASAINRQILKLEDEFGGPLFDRFPGGMRLTVAGTLLLQHITATIEGYGRVRAAIDDLREARSGHVTIAALDSLLVDFLPRALARFGRDFPAINHTVLAAAPAEIAQMVSDGAVDIGLTFVSPLPGTVHFIAEVPAPIGVVMPVDHPLTARLSVSFDEARSYPVLDQAGPLPRGADIDADFSQFKAQLKPKITSNSIQMIRVCIELGLGIAFFTRLGFLKEIENGEIAWRPLTSPGVNALRIGMITSANREPSPPAVQLAKSLIDDLGRLNSN